MNETRILIVDDEASSLELLGTYLKEQGYNVSCAENGKECMEKVGSFKPDIVVLDIRLPDASGLDILRKLKEDVRSPYVIIMTAFHDMDTTIKAIKLGAFEYIPKPIDVDELESAIGRALDLTRSRQKEKGLVIDSDHAFLKGEIVGKTREMKEIFKTIGILSGNRVTVLIEGETGTGKELVARAIHFHSPYKDEPFIAINCSAIVENLLESELFGHERGAFTGAVATKRGKFEIAGQGSILLDEVGEIPIEIQSKLLRFLQEREFQRVGGEKTIRSSARVIAATNRDLLQMVKGGTFREDLYYRLSVATIKIPPLRERKADIPIIIERLLKGVTQDLHKEIDQVEEQALQRMLAYEWPGNVRELENVLTGAAMYTQGGIILDKVVAPLIGGAEVRTEARREPMAKVSSTGGPERERLLGVLEEVRWHYGDACKVLGISRPTLNKRLKACAIPLKNRQHNS